MLAYLVPVPSQDELGGLCQKGMRCKNGQMADTGAPVSLDGCIPSGLLVFPVLSLFCTRKSRTWWNVHSVTSSPGLSRTKSSEL